MLNQLLKHELLEIRERGKSAAVAHGTLQFHMALMWNYEDYRKSLGDSDAHIDQLRTAQSRVYPDWTAEQVEVSLAIGNLRGAANQELGIDRRILRDDPAELAVAVALGARVEWLNRRLDEQSGLGSPEDDAFVLLLALPVRDDALINRVLALPNLEPDPERRFVYEGVAAAYRRDLVALEALVTKFGKRKVDRSIQGMRTCLTGIARREPTLVSQGLHELLEEENRLRKRKEGRVISLEAHQFYRLCEWVLPELVGGFDVTQGLPWDAGFHAWTEAHPNALAGWDLREISPMLHALLIDLCLPEGWREIAEPELPQDICRLVLESVGPNPRKVREMVDAWCRLRRWEPVDLDASPLVISSDVPRMNAFMMRQSLLEAGASARFERVRDGQ